MPACVHLHTVSRAASGGKFSFVTGRAHFPSAAVSTTGISRHVTEEEGRTVPCRAGVLCKAVSVIMQRLNSRA